MEQQTKKSFYKRGWFIASTVILVLVLIGSSDSNTRTQTTQQNTPVSDTSQPPVVSAEAKEKAMTELNEVMALAKKAGLVSSYEFSEGANVVYINPLWYTQKVEFKKDFLAKIATLKEIARGSHRFQVRDAYSNEKVAEVTAFSSV